MTCKTTMMWPLLFIGLLVATPVETTFTDPQHEKAPAGLFITAADVAQVREAVRASDRVARWADELIIRAESSDVAELPGLSRDWWDTDRDKPWGETYPQVFQHTWLEPYEWANLARACAYAHLLQPSPQLAEKAKATLLSLSDYTFEFEHYDVGMNYTVWGVVALDAYAILYESFDASQRRRLDAPFSSGSITPSRRTTTTGSSTSRAAS